MPWLKGKRPFLVPDGDLARLTYELEGAGFRVATIDGTSIRDERDLLTALGLALHFPDYYGVNWDAYDECFNDFAFEHGQPLALIWRRADLFATKDVFAFARATHFLIEDMDYDSTLLPGFPDHRHVRDVQAELFFTI